MRFCEESSICLMNLHVGRAGTTLYSTQDVSRGVGVKGVMEIESECGKAGGA